jgi:hypothetical protein
MMGTVARPRATVCHAGHELTPANVRRNANGAQECLACARRRSRDWQRRRRARLPVVDDKQPKTIALVVWREVRPPNQARDFRASFTYFASHADAARAAPRDAPFTVVDLSRKPWRRMPSIDELVGRTRPPLVQRYDKTIWGTR